MHLFNLDYIVVLVTTKTFKDRMHDSSTQGEYEFASKRISLMEYPDSLFPDSSVAHRILLCFTLVHECGEAVWRTLSEQQIARWSKISWSRNDIDPHQHFLTQYAYTENSKEDFCEHFAAQFLPALPMKIIPPYRIEVKRYVLLFFI